MNFNYQRLAFRILIKGFNNSIQQIHIPRFESLKQGDPLNNKYYHNTGLLKIVVLSTAA